MEKIFIARLAATTLVACCFGTMARPNASVEPARPVHARAPIAMIGLADLGGSVLIGARQRP